MTEATTRMIEELIKQVRSLKVRGSKAAVNSLCDKLEDQLIRERIWDRTEAVLYAAFLK